MTTPPTPAPALTPAQHRAAIRRAVKALWGKRCKLYHSDCALCKKWKHADALTGDKPLCFRKRSRTSFTRQA